MRILYMANNWVGWQVGKWLREQGADIVGLVVHPENRQKYGREIIETVSLPLDQIFTGNTLHMPQTLEQIRALEPDLGLSIFFGYIIRASLLNIFPDGCLNLHPAYLPYNRGSNPNIWSIIDGTPAGVTIHYIDEHIDTGDIIAQRLTPILPTDTGKTLYERLEKASLALFQDTWPQIVNRALIGAPQIEDAGTYHRMRDVEQVDVIDLDRYYQARELINILRARTFPPYPGAYFEENGQRIYLRLALLSEADLKGEQ